MYKAPPHPSASPHEAAVCPGGMEPNLKITEATLRTSIVPKVRRLNKRLTNGYVSSTTVLLVHLHLALKLSPLGIQFQGELLRQGR